MYTTDSNRRSWFIVLSVFLAVLCVKAAFIWIMVPIGKEHGLLPLGGVARDFYFDIATNLATGHGYRITVDTAETMMRARVT